MRAFWHTTIGDAVGNGAVSPDFLAMPPKGYVYYLRAIMWWHDQVSDDTWAALRDDRRGVSTTPTTTADVLDHPSNLAHAGFNSWGTIVTHPELRGYRPLHFAVLQNANLTTIQTIGFELWYDLEYLPASEYKQFLAVSE